MSGLVPSPLAQIFRHNGYEVNTLYRDSYFGSRKGPFVDFYDHNKILSVCDLMGSVEQKLGFYGACFVRRTDIFPSGGKVSGSSTAHLKSYLENKLFKRDQPQILFAHLIPPSHVNRKTFRRTAEQLAAARKIYELESRIAATNLRIIKDLIVSNDPDSIIFVFGDHGVYLSNVERFEDDRAFFVQDRFGVLGGIYPATACASTFDNAYADGFLTTAWVARLIVQCLADGVDPFTNDYKHDVLFIFEHRYRPKDYLYE